MVTVGSSLTLGGNGGGYGSGNAKTCNRINLVSSVPSVTSNNNNIGRGGVYRGTHRVVQVVTWFPSPARQVSP